MKAQGILNLKNNFTMFSYAVFATVKPGNFGQNDPFF